MSFKLFVDLFEEDENDLIDSCFCVDTEIKMKRKCFLNIFVEKSMNFIKENIKYFK